MKHAPAAPANKPSTTVQQVTMSVACSTAELDTEIKSPISLVHECALKRNLTVSFEIVKEVGPPHMRTFVMKCLMGDVYTQGEGNGKRVSIFESYFLRFKKVGTLLTTISGDSVTRELPADDDETSCANKGPTPSQLCQGPWPVGHGPW